MQFLNKIAHFASYFTMISVRDIIDILLLTVVFFCVFLFVKERRAAKLVLGVIFLLIFLLICNVFNLEAMNYLLSNFFEVGIVLLVIIFQPEIRSGLEKMGDNSVRGIKRIGEGNKNQSQTLATIDSLSNAIFDLAKTKTGAIIVFERNTKLGDLILTGTVLNAQVSTYLLRNIFFINAPLHDGAVVIRDNRIYAAGCLLPLSLNPDIIKDLGTRHRAAIGVSENSDCVAVVVSEETGIVSLAHEGKIYRNFTRSSIKKKLEEYLVQNAKPSKRKRGAKININKD